MTWQTSYLATSILLGASEEDALASLSPLARDAAQAPFASGRSRPAKAQAMATILRTVVLGLESMELRWRS